MLNSEMKEKIVEVIGRILSESAFIFVDPIEEENIPAIDQWEPEGVSLSFSGYKSGMLSLCACDDFLRNAAANMLGIDEESDDAGVKGMDALKEILNIIVGNLLTALYGTEEEFDLGIPQKLSSESIITDYKKENAIWLEAEGNPVLFLIDIE